MAAPLLTVEIFVTQCVGYVSAALLFRDALEIVSVVHEHVCMKDLEDDPLAAGQTGCTTPHYNSGY